MSAKKFSLLEAFIWLIVLLLIMLLASPIAMGFLFKDTYHQMLDEVSESTQLNVTIISFDRGLYSSDVLLEVSAPDMPMNFQFREEIVHGPVYLGLINQGKMPFVMGVVKGEMIVPQQFQAQANTFFGGRPPLQYQQIVDFSNVARYQAYVPAINVQLPDESGLIQVSSSGLLMNGIFNLNDKTSSGDLNMPSFSISGQGGEANASDLKFNFSIRPGDTGLLMGDSNISLKRLEIQPPGKDQVALHDFRISGLNSEVGRLVNSSVRLQAREVYASNDRFGPITFVMTMNGLNADALLKIQAMQKDVAAKQQQGIPQEQINAMIAGEMMGLVPDLIKQADIKINPLKVESELGVMETTLSFSVEGLDSNAPADPFFLLGALNLDVDMNVDEALMKQIIEWQIQADDGRLASNGEPPAADAEKPMSDRVAGNLKQMQSGNWLRLEEGVYRTQLSMHQGQLVLNGTQVNPMQLMQQQQGGVSATP